jgi:lipoyl(octanoyl) transferase
MEAHVAAMINGQAADRLWFLEHPPTYTAGTSATETGIKNVVPAEAMTSKDPGDPGFRRGDTVGAGGGPIPSIPLYESGRGGQHTYHGPGQRVVYAMLTLNGLYPTPDIRRYVHDLEEWIIRALADLGVVGERRPGRIGIWVVKPDGTEAKIAALGIRVRRGVAFHGLAINVNPNLTHFDGIIPCGISDYGVTSLADLGNSATMADLDRSLTAQFYNVFARAA